MSLSNGKIVVGAVAVVMGMLTLALASKPLYDAFCRVTGFGGTTRVATAAPDQILEREVTVRFDANVSGLPLLFKADQASHTVRLGQHALAFYDVTNTSDQAVVAIAGYNVAPHKTGPYFNKLECFCFDERVFPPGETKKLPVVFFVSPDMEGETLLEDVTTITLSYTFYPVDEFEGAAKTASLNPVVAQQ